MVTRSVQLKRIGIRFRTDFTNTILDVLKSRPGWVDAKESDPDDWDFFWADKLWVRESLPKNPLKDFQRLNHFPNFYEFCFSFFLSLEIAANSKKQKNNQAHSEGQPRQEPEKDEKAAGERGIATRCDV